jgi:hypothetical protein
MNNYVFRGTMTCSKVDSYQRFYGTYSPVFRASTLAAGASEALEIVYQTTRRQVQERR